MHKAFTVFTSVLYVVSTIQTRDLLGVCLRTCWYTSKWLTVETD